MPPALLFDLGTVTEGRVLYDQAQIMEINPQRHEMVQLNAIVHLDPINHLIVGYKDVRKDEFWVRGHMPDFPLLPGVLLCEAAAQLTGFYSMKCDLVDGTMIVFSGMDNVRFRGQVRAGQRVWFVGKATKISRRQNIFAVQAFIKAKMVFEAEIFGMPFTPEVISEASPLE